MASKELTYLSTEGPFNVYERRKQKEPIDSLKEFQKEMDSKNSCNKTHIKILKTNI